jgi:hypothetical protein
MGMIHTCQYCIPQAEIRTHNKVMTAKKSDAIQPQPLTVKPLSVQNGIDIIASPCFIVDIVIQIASKTDFAFYAGIDFITGPSHHGNEVKTPPNAQPHKTGM